MTLAWEKVAAAIRAARDAMQLTQDDLAARTGLNRMTIGNLEGSYKYKRIPTTIIKVGEVFGWDDPMEVARRIARGEPAPPVNPQRTQRTAGNDGPSPPGTSIARGMPMRLERELSSDNRVVDSTIVEVDGLKLVVLLMAPEGTEVSDRQLASGLAAWSEMEARARNMDLTGSDQEDS